MVEVTVDRAGGQGRERPRILLVDVAPDLVRLIRRTFPDVEIRIAGDTDLLDRLLTEAWSVLLVDLDTVRLGQVLPHTERLPVVGVTSSAGRAAEPGELADVLLEPVLGADLRDSLGGLLDDVGVGSPEQRRLARVRTGMRTASLLAVALGLSVAALVGPVHGLELPLAAVAMVVGVVRLGRRAREHDRALTAASIVVAAALLLVTDGAESRYLVHASLVAAEAGLVLGHRAAATAAGALALSTVPAGIASLGDPGAVRSWGTAAVVLACVVMTATLARRLWQDDAGEPAPDLVRLHQALDTVLHTTGRLPEAPALPDAVAAVLHEATTSWDATAGVVLVEQDGALVEVGSTGLPAHVRQVLAAEEPLAALLVGAADSCSVADETVPVTYRQTSTVDSWTLTPLTHRGMAVGALLWTGHHALNDHRRRGLRALSTRGGLAIATARRFERVRSLATDDDRARLRTVLETEVFQQLLSLRYEVEALAAAPDAAALRAELDRLAARTRDAAALLRDAADRLTTEPDSVGLAAALRRHCRDLATLGVARPELDLSTRQRPSRDAEVVVYELATTAINDAIAAGNDVTVRLLARDESVVVEVVDDGSSSASGGGALERMAAAAAEFGIAVTRDVTPTGRVVAITAAPMRWPVDGLVP